MWYFAWVLGLGFAVCLSILNAMWGDFEHDRDGDWRKQRAQGDDGQDL